MTTAYDDLLVSLGLTPSGEPRRPVAECGTPSGYVRHRRLDQEPCDDCRAANTTYKNARRRAQKDAAAMPPVKHGTPNGARQHYYRGEKPCKECRHAYNTLQGPSVAARRRQARAARKQRAAA